MAGLDSFKNKIKMQGILLGAMNTGKTKCINIFVNFAGLEHPNVAEYLLIGLGRCLTNCTSSSDNLSFFIFIFKYNICNNNFRSLDRCLRLRELFVFCEENVCCH